MSQFETQILYGCFLLFDCERKSFYICLAFLQGSLHSLFFGEPHHHIACFTCIQLRGRLILWRENPVFVRELDLGLFPQQSCPSQLHIWQRDLWHGTYSCKFSFFLSSLFFFSRTVFCYQGCYALNRDSQFMYQSTVQNASVVSLPDVDSFVNTKHSVDVRSSCYRCN